MGDALWRYVLVSESEIRRARLRLTERLQQRGIDPTRPYDTERTANGDYCFWQQVADGEVVDDRL